MNGVEKSVLSKKQDVVRGQLALRAVVWDVLKNVPKAEIEKLNKELETYSIQKIVITDGAVSFGSGCCMKYGYMLQKLREAGILKEQTVLVTDDCAFASYVQNQAAAASETAIKEYQTGQEFAARSGRGMGRGIAVVYYEDGRGEEFIAADIVVQGFEEIGIQFLDRILKRRNRLPWNILYTPRTYVREITLADLDELYALYAEEGITDFTEPLFEREKEEAYTQSYIDWMYYYYGYGMWIVRDRETDALIGRAGIELRETEDGALQELGYVIGRKYQNKGYATEVCQSIMEYASQELEIRQLHVFIHPENLASIRVAQKLGFAKCGGLVEDMLHYRKSLGEDAASAVERQ